MRTDEHFHVLGCGTNDLAYYQQAHASNGNMSTTQKVRKSSAKGADGSRSQEVARDEPDPPIRAPNVAVHLRRDAPYREFSAVILGENTAFELTYRTDILGSEKPSTERTLQRAT